MAICSDHENIIRVGIVCTTRYKQKTEIFRVTRPPTCWKDDSCFRFLRKDKIGIKANL